MYHKDSSTYHSNSFHSVSSTYEPQNDDLDGLELTVSVISPAEVDISSEKVDQGDLSSIDGYSSASSGFDMAFALEGDSAFIEIDLTVRITVRIDQSEMRTPLTASVRFSRRSQGNIPHYAVLYYTAQ